MNKRNGMLLAIVFLSTIAVVLIGRDRRIDHKEEPKKDIIQEVDTTSKFDQYHTMNGVLLQQPLLNADVLNEECGQEEGIDTLEEVDTQALLQEEAKEALNITNPQLGISAKAAVLMNANDNTILYHKNALKKIQPASTAKLLTAVVAIELSDQNEKFIVGKEINLIAPDSSRAYLSKGQILSLEHILDALLLPSGNDAAYVIAANLGRKIGKDPDMKAKEAVRLFIEQMNIKAKEFGAVKSNFMTPDGYDEEGQYTTAYDMAVIASNALKHSEILSCVKKQKARDILISGDDVTWYNSNKLLSPESGYYYKYAIGLKTGTSSEAGRCLISAGEKDGEQYVSVVMNASYEGRWQDSIELLRYGIEGI